jgi:hypothetical protein
MLTDRFHPSTILHMALKWRRQTRVAVPMLATGLIAASAWAAAVVNAPLVLTQVPADARRAATNLTAAGVRRADWFEGARVILVLPDGQANVLTKGFHSACDPAVSFDGRRILFAGKKDRQSPWRIYEIGLDGQGLRPVTPENQDARSPVYLSTLFTLNSPEPWFTIAYVAQENTLNELGQPSASSLYNIKLDGTDPRRLTFTPNNNFDPFQMGDGRVIYAAEWYPMEPGVHPGRVGLFGIHMEGADMELFGGELGRRIQQMPCATGKDLVVFVESDDATWDGAGQLACVCESRPHVTYRRLTKDPAWLFLYPSPWRDNRVLVSRRSADGHDTCGVYAFDADRGRCELVFDSPEYHDVQVRVAQPRHSPDGHSTVVNTRTNTGIFYGLNCYDADERMRTNLSPGTFKRVRFIEGILQPAPNSARPVEPQGPWVPRRLIGEAPVEADGSFNVAVPASTPIQLQALDGQGLALATCGWIWVQPKETRGCIGCHEDPELIPENRYVLALRRPSNELTLPPDQRRSVTFRENIIPILRNRCAAAGCHGGPGGPLPLPLNTKKPGEDDLRQAYAALLAPREVGHRESRSGKYVDAGRARTSFLVWQLFGTNTSRPWDRAPDWPDSGSRKVKPMPPPGSSPPGDEELRTLVQWIDLGAQYEAPVAFGNRNATEIK